MHGIVWTLKLRSESTSYSKERNKNAVFCQHFDIRFENVPRPNKSWDIDLSRQCNALYSSDISGEN